jgi:branched-chain amino acid transport system substrate-binding protein
MKKTLLWLGLIVIVIGVVVTLSGDRAPDVGSKEPIKIGFIGPLTGDLATLGQNAKSATEIAVEEVNKAGGVNGRPLEIIYEDGQCDGKVATNAANKLINIDKVPVILGGLCSSETSSFAGMAEQSKVVTLSYCSSAPNISQAGDYIFRDYPSDLYQGAFGAEYAFDTLDKKKVAILFVKGDWGTGIKNVFASEFKKLGGEILAEEGYDATARDLRTQITKIKATKPDLVYFLGYTDASIPGLKQVRELGLSVPLLGGDAWDDPKIYEDAGVAAEGIMYTVPFAPLNDSFKEAMATKTGSSDVLACSPGAYDGIKILSQVMEKVGTNSTAIKDELYKVDYRDGVSSTQIRFDENGDPVGASYVVKVVRSGKSEVLK